MPQADYKRPPAGNNKPRPHHRHAKLGPIYRDAIEARAILRRLQTFCLSDPDNPDACAGTRMTRTQVHVALALLKKILPDLASIEVSGNPDKPLMVQVVRFSDGEQLSEPRPIIDMPKLLEMDRVEAKDIEVEVAKKKPTGGAAHRYRLRED
jgi:hypothetical protein